MKRIINIFIALSLCTIPALGEPLLQYCKDNKGSARLNCEQLTFTCSNGLKDDTSVNFVLNTKCKESLQKKLGQNCNADNAIKATWSSIGEHILCIPQNCKCGYEIQENKCVSWGENPPTCSAKNAQTAHKKCEGDKEVCIIDECKKDTPVLNKEKNKCDKCPQGQEPDGNGNCKNTVNKQKKLDKEAAIADLLSATCEEDNNERGTVSANCINGKITVKCAGAKTGGTVNNQDYGKAICPNTKSNITFNIEVIESKEVTNAKDKKTCEEQGNKGEWKSNRCVCKNKGDIFDDDRGCIAGTAAFVDAQQYLDNLYSELQKKLQEIEQQQPQPQP